MTTEPDAIKTVFLGALGKDSRAERAAYLDETCAGNTALRQRVEALLQAHDKPDQLLDQPAAEHLAAQNGSIPLDFLEPFDKPGVLGRLGHYEVLEVVGQGGMGVVLRAFDEKLHRVVAIKALAPVLANHTEARARFVREAQATAAVTHDNVISIHAVEDSGPIPYLVMQFVDGCTVQDKIDRAGSLPLKEILRIGLQTAEGLAAAHRQELIHRDIKPANILLENGVERVKITDFGLARSSRDNSLTKSGIIAGTPAYMSPEQANGEHVDHRSDLFSLGSVLYTLCAGHAPFRADTAMAVLKRVCEETPRPVREINPAIPEWLEALVAKLQAKNPADRFASADEVAGVLGRCLAKLQADGSCGEVETEVLNRLLPRRVARKRSLVVAGIVAAALVVAIAGWLIYKSQFATDNTATANSTPEPPTPPDPVPTKPVVLKPSRPPLLQHTKGVRTLAFSRDGTVMASGGLDRNIYLWDTKTWQARGPLPGGHPGDVTSLAFSPNGTRVASVTSAHDTCRVRIWDVATGKPAPTLGKASRGMWDVAYSPDGESIACGGWDMEVRILDVVNGDELLIISNVATAYLRRLSFSRDGQQIATGGTGPTRVRSTTTGEIIATRVALPEGMCPTFLPDGTGLAGWNHGDGRITICDWPSGQVRHSWPAHPGSTIEDLAVSPDGRFLASIGGDGGVRVWSTADFTEVATLIGHKGSVQAVAFSPDGAQLATGGQQDFAIHIWDLPAICRVRK